jgi:REP element-mobilizing transposase RayT
MSAGIFHVYTHCVWASEWLFRDDVDRMAFKRELARTTAKSGWTCIGYCLMRTHYHLVVEVETGVLPSAMHALNFRYACQYNVRNGMRGHVFGARYDSPRIRDSEHLLRVYRYVMRNPVEAGLCARPEEWPWSSYAATVGLGQADAFVNASAVLELMDADVVEVAQERLRTYVDLRDEDVTGPGPGRVPPGLANERDISYVSY